MATTHTSRTGTFPEEGIKAPCVVAAIANITLSGEQTVNTVACVAGDRVLTTAQTDTTENAILVCATGAWARASDWEDARDVTSGVCIPTPGYLYQATFTGDFVAGTTAVTMTDVSSATTAAAAAASEAAALASEQAAAASEAAAAASAATAEAYAIPSVQTLTSSGGAASISVMSDYVAYEITLTEDTTLSFTNTPAAGKFKDIFVKVIQHASDAKTFTVTGASGNTAGGAYTASATLSSEETLGIRVYNGAAIEMYPSGVFG